MKVLIILVLLLSLGLAALGMAAPVQKLYYVSKVGTYDYWQVWRADPDGTNRQQLTNMPGHCTCPTLIEGGTKISFTLNETYLHTMNPDGSNVTPIYAVYPDGVRRQVVSSRPLSYSATRDEYLITPRSNPVGAAPYTYSLLDLHESTVTYIQGAPNSWSGNCNFMSDGEHVVLSTCNGYLPNFELWAGRLDGNQLVDQVRLTNNSYEDNYPQVSPTGLIAYHSRPGGHFNICTINYDGTGQITRVPYSLPGYLGDKVQPSFTQNPNEIVFCDWSPSNVLRRIYRYNLDTGLLEVPIPDSPGRDFGNPRQFIVDDPTVQPCAVIQGTVTGNCQGIDPLYGVPVTLVQLASGATAATVTDEDGSYEFAALEAGEYLLTVSQPLGYVSIEPEVRCTLAHGATAIADFSLTCVPTVGQARGVGFWKYNLGVVTGRGTAQLSASALCGYLDLVANHFNTNEINPVIIYQPAESGECTDNLLVARDLMNMRGQQEPVARARQQLMALLLNVAAGYCLLTDVVSLDGATVSQAITYCDNIIDDAAGDYILAKSIAEGINENTELPAGVIPLDTERIAYRQGVPHGTALPVCYPNPFNPNTTIEFTLLDAGDYRVGIYDAAGRLVRSFQGPGGQGRNSVTWDGRSTSGTRVGSGVYSCVIEANGQSQTIRMTLLK